MKILKIGLQEKNIYRHCCKDKKYFKTSDKGIVCGPLSDLVMYYLGWLEIKITTDLNYDRLYKLYKNNPIGLVKIDHFYYVKEKVFKKFVRANITRILNTAKEQRKEETAKRNRDEKDYWKDLDKESSYGTIL